MKTNLHKHYETDKNLEEQGIDLQFQDGIWFRVRRIGGIESKPSRYFEKISRPFARLIQNRTISDKQMTDLIVKTVVNSVIIDWGGLKDEETGEEIPFSIENAEKLFADENMGEVAKEIIDRAGDIKNFLVQYKEDVGNF